MYGGSFMFHEIKNYKLLWRVYFPFKLYKIFCMKIKINIYVDAEIYIFQSLHV